MRHTVTPKALLFLIGASLFYGLVIIIQKMGLNHGLDALSFTFYRSVYAVLFCVFFYHQQVRHIARIDPQAVFPLISFILASSVVVVALIFGQRLTSAINAGFLIRMTPIFALPMAWVFLRERVPGRSVFFMFVMLGGAFLLSTSGTLLSPCWGDIIMVMVAAAIAFQNIISKRIMWHVPPEMVIFAKLGISSFLVAVFFLLVFPARSLAGFADSFWYALGAGVAYALTVVFQYHAIKLVSAFLATVFFLFGSLFSAGFAYVLLGETISPVQWIGAVGILIGGYCMVNQPRTAPQV